MRSFHTFLRLFLLGWPIIRRWVLVTKIGQAWGKVHVLPAIAGSRKPPCACLMYLRSPTIMWHAIAAPPGMLWHAPVIPLGLRGPPLLRTEWRMTGHVLWHVGERRIIRDALLHACLSIRWLHRLRHLPEGWVYVPHEPHNVRLLLDCKHLREALVGLHHPKVGCKSANRQLYPCQANMQHSVILIPTMQETS